MVQKAFQNHRTTAQLSVAGGLLACVLSVAVLVLVFVKDRALISDADAADWRTVLLVWALVAVVIAGLLLFRSTRLNPRNSSGDTSHQRLTVLSKVTLSFAVLLLAISFQAEALESKVSALFERQWPATISQNAICKTLKVPIDCAGCAKSIERTIRCETVAEKAVADPAKGQIAVWIDPEKTSLSAIAQALKSHGFNPEEKPSQNRVAP